MRIETIDIGNFATNHQDDLHHPGHISFDTKSLTKFSGMNKEIQDLITDRQKQTLGQKIFGGLVLIGVVAAVYKAASGDTDQVLDDAWTGAKKGMQTGAVVFGTLGVGLGVINARKYIKDENLSDATFAQKTIIVGGAGALSGAITGLAGIQAGFLIGGVVGAFKSNGNTVDLNAGSADLIGA